MSISKAVTEILSGLQRGARPPSATTVRKLEAILESPMVDQAIASRETELLADRRKRVLELDRLPATFAAKHEVASLRCTKAIADLELKRAAFKAAEAEYTAATLAAHYGAHNETAERHHLEESLRDDAPYQLEMAAREWDSIATRDVPCALVISPDERKRRHGIWPAISSNVEDVSRATTAINDAVAEARAMQLRAVSQGDVADFILDASTRLAKVLAPLGLNTASVHAETVECGLPITFGGTPMWLIDEPRRPSREDIEADSKTRTARAARNERVNG